MKQVKINRLIIKDWRGQSKDIVLTQDNEVRGWNKSGKSTILNAILWLLLGTDDQDRQNFQLFDNTIEQTHDTSKVAIVEAKIDIDGNEYSLKKTAEMGWTRKRGHEEYERKGTDNYKFFIDDIERNATEYKTFVEDMFAPMDKLKFMLNTQYFMSVKWDVLRKHMQDLSGGITESDFKGDYGIISSDLKKYSSEDLKKQYKAKLKPIKESVNSLPISIETLQNCLANPSDLNLYKNTIEENKRQIADIDARINGNKISDDVIKKQEEELGKLDELNQELYQLRDKYIEEFRKEESSIMDKIHSAKSRNAEIKALNIKNENERARLITDIDFYEKSAKYSETTHNDLTKQNEAIKALKFNGYKCPMCGQELPQDKIDEAMAEFENNKRAKHEAVVNQGKENRERWNNALKTIDGLKIKLANIPECQPLIVYSNLDKELSDLRAAFSDFRQIKEYKEKLDQIELFKANMAQHVTVDNTSLLKMKQSLLDEIIEYSKKLGDYEKQQAKVKEMQEELRSNASEMAMLEGKLSALARYEEERSKIVGEKVNRLFDYISVEMETEDKSGNKIPCCVVKDKDNVYAQVTNTASRILCGIDMALAFQKHYDIQMPLIIDNCEGLNENNRPRLENQTIELIVDECDFNVVNK